MAFILTASLTACGASSSGSGQASSSENKQEQAVETSPSAQQEAEETAVQDGEYYNLTCALFTSQPNEINAVHSCFDKIRKATDGHVEVTCMDSGVLCSASEMSDFLSAGAIEIGQLRTDLVSGMSFVSDVVTMPLQGFDDNVKATRVLWDLYEEEADEYKIRRQWGSEYKVLQLYCSPAVICKTELPEDVSDVVGKSCGVALCVSRDSWDKLPEQYRKIVDGLSGREASVASAEGMKEDLPELRGYLDGRYELLDPSDPEYAQWQEQCDLAVNKWAAGLAFGAGVDGTALLEHAKELYAGY